MVRNIKLTISYDGTNYCGWQKQNNVLTIQENIENAIYAITNERVDLFGSGRTDANVHALGQVANFKTSSLIPIEKITAAINTKLNEDIRILKSEEVDIDFNSRYSSKEKTYIYQIYNSRVSSPFYNKYAYHVPYKLDLSIMKEALKKLEGEHDFKAFMPLNTDVRSTIRTIYGTDVKIDNNLIKIEITGNGFLYNMVRIIVGTVIKIASKKRDIACIEEALKTGKRQVLGPTARPYGLFLKEVKY